MEYFFQSLILFQKQLSISYSIVCNKRVILGNLTAWFRPKTWHISETSKNCHGLQQIMNETSLRNRDSLKWRLDLDSACLKTSIQHLFWQNYCLMRVHLALTSSCLPLFIVEYQNWLTNSTTKNQTRDLSHTRRQFCHWDMVISWCE